MPTLGACDGGRWPESNSSQEDTVSTSAPTRGGVTDRDTSRAARRLARLSTETKAAFKTPSSLRSSPSSSASSSPAPSSTRPTPAVTAPGRSGSTPPSSPSATWSPAVSPSPAAATRTTQTPTTGRTARTADRTPERPRNAGPLCVPSARNAVDDRLADTSPDRASRCAAHATVVVPEDRSRSRA